VSFLFCVDDDDLTCEMISTILRGAGHEIIHFKNGAEAVQAVATQEPHLVVLDIDMPGMSGIELCAQLKTNPFTAGIPILMLTARSDIDQKIEGFDAGADDYLTKPFHPAELQARVEALLRLVKRESDRNPTSGLPGGRAIREEIERRVARGKHSGEHFAICYIDLDHFKAFADTFGFSIADEVIARTATALCDAVKAAVQQGNDQHDEDAPVASTEDYFVGHRRRRFPDCDQSGSG
jgi:DNA-binding response OmpR family regulator